MQPRFTASLWGTCLNPEHFPRQIFKTELKIEALTGVLMSCGLSDSNSVTSGISCRLWNSHRSSVPQHRQRVYKGIQQRWISLLRPTVPHVHRHDADRSHL